jgi:hypothetical protein
VNIEQRIEELLAEQAALATHRQEVAAAMQQDEANLHRLAGAIAILREQVAGEPVSNGQYQELESSGINDGPG